MVRKSNTLLKLTLISVAGALLLGFLGAWLVRAVTGRSYLQYTRGELLVVSRMIESGPYSESIKKYDELHSDSPSMTPLLWVVSPEGKILASNTSEPLPGPWEEFPRPAKAHEIGYRFQPFQIFPSGTVVRLGVEPPTYLVVRRMAGGMRKQVIETTLISFFLTVGVAVFFSLFGAFLYLRMKSVEARSVLSSLAQGDLKARFTIREFDEVGSLMLEFNKMADEIERLVCRIRRGDEERSRLVAELSHDLRTPLTSIRASIDTLADHFEDVPSEQRREFLKMIQAEIAYFARLMDDLHFVSRLGDTSYRSASESFDLRELLRAEVELRRTQEQSGGRGLSWSFDPASTASISITGDPFLIRRLVRNAFENASRYAREKIEARILAEEDRSVLIEVRDDGPGISDDQREAFGKPKRHRIMSEGRPCSGLGSVIMKRIVDLHGGDLEIRNASAESGGTLLRISLPVRLSS